MRVEIKGSPEEKPEPVVRLWLAKYGEGSVRLMAQVGEERADYLAIFSPGGAERCVISDSCPELEKWAKDWYPEDE